MDAFYAWIKQRDHPEAREKPVGSADRANVVSPRLQATKRGSSACMPRWRLQMSTTAVAEGSGRRRRNCASWDRVGWRSAWRRSSGGKDARATYLTLQPRHMIATGSRLRDTGRRPSGL